MTRKFIFIPGQQRKLDGYKNNGWKFPVFNPQTDYENCDCRLDYKHGFAYKIRIESKINRITFKHCY